LNADVNVKLASIMNGQILSILASILTGTRIIQEPPKDDDTDVDASNKLAASPRVFVQDTDYLIRILDT